jgi:PKD repeat protein
MKRIAIVIGTLGLLSGMSFGYGLCGYDWDYYANPMGEDIRINTHECGVNADSARDRIIDGMDSWNGQADFVFNYGGTTGTQEGSYDGNNIVGFEDDYTQEYVAVTYIWSSGGNISECDMRFNTYDYNWHDGSGACGGSEMDIWNVATHEFGHFLCLEDLYGGGDAQKTMYGYVAYGETKKRDLHSDDIAGIQAIYGGSPAPPVAEFSGSPTNGYAPLEVDFTDLSTGSITSWKWYFGDGDSSMIQSPSHTYTAIGQFDVTLTVTGPGGSDTETKYDYITTTEAPPSPDSAWLSLDPSGLPILAHLTVNGDESKVIGMILKNASDSAHSVMFPVWYDTSCLDLVSLDVDSSTYPFSDIGLWTFFERDTVMNDSGKVLLFAYTTTSVAGFAPGLHRVGTVEFQGIPPASDSSECVLDTCFYPPAGHLYYTDARSSVDYWPEWTPTDVVVYPQSGLCGDANGDMAVTTGDGYYVLNYFGSGPAPASCWAANVNGDGNLTTGDGFHILNYFGSGPGFDCQPCDL